MPRCSRSCGRGCGCPECPSRTAKSPLRGTLEMPMLPMRMPLLCSGHFQNSHRKQNISSQPLLAPKAWHVIQAPLLTFTSMRLQFRGSGKIPLCWQRQQRSGGSGVTGLASCFCSGIASGCGCQWQGCQGCFPHEALELCHGKLRLSSPATPNDQGDHKLPDVILTLPFLLYKPESASGACT